MTMITQPYSRRHWTVFTRQLANNHGDKHTQAIKPNILSTYQLRPRRHSQ